MDSNREICNKTIYMTYKKEVPSFVFDRWKELNPKYTIDFSLDDQCYDFISKTFCPDMAEFWKYIPRGANKADLWRLCKLYIHGGVYADIDLVPYLDIDKVISETNGTLYSCLNLYKNGIFQAFIISMKPRDPLLLNLIISFMLNKPFSQLNDTTFNFYNVLKYNTGCQHMDIDKMYSTNFIKIQVNVPPTPLNMFKINLYYFPKDVEYQIVNTSHPYADRFETKIENNYLYVKRIDKFEGWGAHHKFDIIIKSYSGIYLFEETCKPNDHWKNSYVTYKGTKILDSRDMTYYDNGSKW